jgi:hypothetical protein
MKKSIRQFIEAAKASKVDRCFHQENEKRRYFKIGATHFLSYQHKVYLANKPFSRLLC